MFASPYIRSGMPGMIFPIALLTLLFIGGCAGMEPFEPLNHREEGPSGGVFSGPSGGFTIFRGGDVPRQEEPAEKDAEPQ